MSWIMTASKSALAAGAILLSAGCTSKKDMAIAAKDETIRRQESQISSAEQSRAAADQEARLAAEQANRSAEAANRAAALNAQLAAQNTEIAERNIRAVSMQTQQLNASTQRIGQMQDEIVQLESVVKGMNCGKTVVVTQPGMPVEHEHGQSGNVSRDAQGGIHIQVAGSVLFDAGHAELKPSCSDTLMHIAQTIKTQFPNHAIRIEGHTDCTPVVHSRDKYPDNMALSQARAQAVYDFLAKRGGMASGKMYTAGYGERQPLVSPERTPSDRAKNRRVEIVILPNNLKVQKDQLAHAEGQARPYQTGATPASVQK